MADYFVSWEIEITADNPLDAARKALDIHRDPHSRATVFSVADGDCVETIDLENT